MKYRKRKIIRLHKYDYSRNGYYFITICTLNRICYFGDIINNIMILSKTGQIILSQLLWLEKQYQYIKIDTYSIMPNHVHVIIKIDNLFCRGGSRPAPTVIQKIKPIPEIIGAFKTTSCKLIRQTEYKYFIWQRSFYDRIIRNDIELNAIREYIKNNPRNWETDRNNRINYFIK